jgi:hypothetical protein
MKSGTLGTGVLVLAGLLLFVIWNSVFVVQQTQQALVLRFGAAQKVITEPGLNFKVPFIDSVVTLEKLILDVDVPGKNRPQGEEVITADEPATPWAAGEERKRLVVDAFDDRNDHACREPALDHHLLRRAARAWWRAALGCGAREA